MPPGIWPSPCHPPAGGGGGGHPGAPVYPSHPIYNPPYPDQGLPGSQPHPDQGLPGAQPRPPQPGGPANQPSHGRWVWSPVYGWVYEPGQIAGGGSPPHPDHTLPGSQPHPDHTLPGSQPHPDQGLPPTGTGLPTPQPPGATHPIQPTVPQPKK
jgi:hypothetical protein